jgi:hypothetical protein
VHQITTARKGDAISVAPSPLAIPGKRRFEEIHNTRTGKPAVQSRPKITFCLFPAF